MSSIKHMFFIKVVFVVAILTQTSASCAKNEKADQLNESSKVMANRNQDCNSNRVLRSQLLINFIFEDLNSSYSHTGGGGITSIKEVATNTFEISISQEERIDVLTYYLDMNEACEISLVKKDEATISYGH